MVQWKYRTLALPNPLDPNWQYSAKSAELLTRWLHKFIFTMAKENQPIPTNVIFTHWVSFYTKCSTKGILLITVSKSSRIITGLLWIKSLVIWIYWLTGHLSKKPWGDATGINLCRFLCSLKLKETDKILKRWGRKTEFWLRKI